MDQNQAAMLEGLNRKDVHWNPTINEKLCQNCGVCVKFCKHGVYAIDAGITKVVQPTECVVLCNNCMPQCPHHAIYFPNKVAFLKELRDLRKKKNSDDEFLTTADNDKIICFCENILKIEPKNLKILNHLAIAYSNKGDYDNAILINQKILDLDPQNESAWYNLGSAMNMKTTRMRGP